MMKLTVALIVLAWLSLSGAVIAQTLDEPIKPLPLNINLDQRKVNLGRLLFQDPQLSRNNTISCASCHNLSKAGVDHRRFPKGIYGKDGSVNTPTVFNSGFNFRQFWDGRAETLQEQAEFPIHNPKEMDSSWEEVVGKLKQNDHYAKLFQIYDDGITPKNIADAIATYEKSLYTPNSRFDQYLRGDETALTPQEKRGYELFKSFGCIACHQGMNVGGNMFQKFGVMKDYFKYRRKGKIRKADYGRYNVTGNEADKHYFKVPSLRLVAKTPPYFHDGSAKTLREAVDVMFEFQLGRRGSDEEKNAIISFLKSLVGEFPTDGVVSDVSQ